MPVPQVITQWAVQNYPRPRIDPEWLDGCCDYVLTESSLNVNNAAHLPRVYQDIEAQLLGSDLRDSTVPSTGIPQGLLNSQQNRQLSGPPVLVEIVSITEVGHSAFQLMSTRQMRIDRADLAGMNAERGEDGEREEEDEGPVPRYPRSMLSLELTDGTHTFKAIEYRKVPDLVLGETPLGFKMLLKGVTFRKGTAFLEPANVILKGHQSERDAERDADFKKSLRRRMGLPEEEEPVSAASLAEHTANGYAPAPANHNGDESEMDDFFNDCDVFATPPIIAPIRAAPRQPPPAPPAQMNGGRVSPLFYRTPSPERPPSPTSSYGFNDDSLLADEAIFEELHKVEERASQSIRPATQASSYPSNAAARAHNSSVISLNSDMDEMAPPPPAQRPVVKMERDHIHPSASWNEFEDEVIDLSD